MPNDHKSTRRTEWVLVAALIVLAVLARWAGWREKTNDMNIFFQWYHQLRQAGRRDGIGSGIGNYNAPFTYLLAVVASLPGPLILRMKAIFVLGDVVLAFFTYRLAALRWPSSRVPMAAALIVVLLPTVVLNASFLGQIDAMWAAPAAGGVYFLLRDRPWHAVALCGVALAIKPQAVFVLPLLLLLVLAGRIPWRTLLAAPAAFLVLDLPAVIAGRDPIELLTVYAMDRQARIVTALTYGAPSVWTFVPAVHRVEALRTVGLILAAAVIVGVIYVLLVRTPQFTHERIVTAAALFAILVPFLLPGMHERYFFLADVLTVVMAVHRPRLWFVPVLVQASSLLSYLPYLFGNSSLMLPRTVAAALMLAALLTVGRTLLCDRVTANRPLPQGDDKVIHLGDQTSNEPLTGR
nr:glycosyltransferase 87 family protein [uncultured Actinoplanes sp.]